MAFEVGEIFYTKDNLKIEIIEKLKNKKRIIRFENGYEKEINMSSLYKNNRKIKDVYKKSVFDTGYFGEGEFSFYKNKKAYRTWQNILQRCYLKNEKNPTYKNVKVCKEWHNFQNFAFWFEKNYPKIENINFEIDKDLLQMNIENKIYSPETCVFLPKKVNIFITKNNAKNSSGFIGVYLKKQTNRWVSSCCSFEKNKQIHLGYFDTIEEAREKYLISKKESYDYVIEYLRSLNYLENNIIENIKMTF